MVIFLWTNLKSGMCSFSGFFFNPCNRFKGARFCQPCKHLGDNVKVLHGWVEFAPLLHGLKTKSWKRAHPRWTCVLNKSKVGNLFLLLQRFYHPLFQFARRCWHYHPTVNSLPPPRNPTRREVRVSQTTGTSWRIKPGAPRKIMVNTTRV